MRKKTWLERLFRRPERPRRRWTYKPCLEPFEEREVLTAYTYTGPANGNWEDKANWNMGNDNYPGFNNNAGNDTATVGPGVTVTMTANETISGLSLGSATAAFSGTLQLNGNTLKVQGPMAYYGSTLGLIQGAGILDLNGAFTSNWYGGSVGSSTTAKGTLLVDGGATLNIQAGGGQSPQVLGFDLTIGTSGQGATNGKVYVYKAPTDMVNNPTITVRIGDRTGNSFLDLAIGTGTFGPTTNPAQATAFINVLGTMFVDPSPGAQGQTYSTTCNMPILVGTDGTFSGTLFVDSPTGGTGGAAGWLTVPYGNANSKDASSKNNSGESVLNYGSVILNGSGTNMAILKCSQGYEQNSSTAWLETFGTSNDSLYGGQTAATEVYFSQGYVAMSADNHNNQGQLTIASLFVEFGASSRLNIDLFPSAAHDTLLVLNPGNPAPTLTIDAGAQINLYLYNGATSGIWDIVGVGPGGTVNGDWTYPSGWGHSWILSGSWLEVTHS
jgi:hypothetical protein